MLRQIATRLMFSLLTLFLIATATFAIMHQAPGGPFSRERELPPEIMKNIEHKYNLDQPLFVQYFHYMAHLVQGDLGISFVHENQTVNQIIRQSFPKSAILGIAGFLFAFAVGVPLGVIAAGRADRFADRFLMIIAILGVSVPGFILAGILQYFVAFKLGWAPASGWGESPWQVILPALALGAFPLAFISRLIRASMSNALASDYLRTARAKGVRRSVALFRHGLRNAILPAVSYSGPLLASLLTGSFVVETIFGIAGLGDAFVTSINDRDYTVIMGITIFYSALLIGFNILADILYRLIDPRIA